MGIDLLKINLFLLSEMNIWIMIVGFSYGARAPRDLDAKPDKSLKVITRLKKEGTLGVFPKFQKWAVGASGLLGGWR